MSVVILSAHTIRSRVYDLDFSHVAAFLDSLSEDTIKTFKGDSKRRFIIKLGETDETSPSPSLSRWMTRVLWAFPVGSKGSGIQFHYQVSDLYARGLANGLNCFIRNYLLGRECFECQAEDCWSAPA